MSGAAQSATSLGSKTGYPARVEASEFTEERFFGAIADAAGRVLLIGRRAMVALGIPVLTADYDLWVHFDDVEKLNAAVAPLDLFPNRLPEEARQSSRYVLENDEHVDVMVARAATTPAGERLAFEEAWSRRQRIGLGSTTICVPCLDDLVTTKRWSMREKDVRDIQLIEALRRGKSS
jgi:hypothetical protein